MLLDCNVHCDVAVIGRVDVQWHAAMAGVAGPQRRLAGLEIGVQLRGQGRVGGLLHRHLDEAAPAGALALEQRCEGGSIEVDPGNEIDDCRAGLDRRPSGKPVAALSPETAWTDRLDVRLTYRGRMQP
jgi:hypothetical protein